jgi:hypothetical protein
VTALIPSIMDGTLLFNFPVSLRDVRNWLHLGDVAILANVHFAPEAVIRKRPSMINSGDVQTHANLIFKRE